MSVAPYCPRASPPSSQLLLNHEVIIVIIWLENTQILHGADNLTGFQNATVISGKAADDILMFFEVLSYSVYSIS